MLSCRAASANDQALRWLADCSWGVEVTASFQRPTARYKADRKRINLSGRDIIGGRRGNASMAPAKQFSEYSSCRQTTARCRANQSVGGKWRATEIPVTRDDHGISYSAYENKAESYRWCNGEINSLFRNCSAATGHHHTCSHFR